jgi:hypothetical protein
MAYVIVGIVVVLVIAGLVAYVVMNASRKSGAAAVDDGTPGIGRDATPLGDTAEHAGDHDGAGRTVADPEDHAPDPGDADAAAHRARPGEAEGTEQLGFEGERPGGDR